MVGSAVGEMHLVAFVVLSRQLVPAELHALELLGLPPVHLQRAHERDVDAEVSMVRGAVVAKEDPDVCRRPLRVLLLAVKAHLDIEYFVLLCFLVK